MGFGLLVGPNKNPGRIGVKCRYCCISVLPFGRGGGFWTKTAENKCCVLDREETGHRLRVLCSSSSSPAPETLFQRLGSYSSSLLFLPAQHVSVSVHPAPPPGPNSTSAAKEAPCPALKIPRGRWARYISPAETETGEKHSLFSLKSTFAALKETFSPPRCPVSITHG